MEYPIVSMLRYNYVQYVLLSGFMMVLRTLKKTVALILLLIFILPAAGCAGLGKDSGPVYNYAIFFADTTKYINSVGELADTSAPYMNAEWLYVPVLTVFEAIGARIKDHTVTIKGTDGTVYAEGTGSITVTVSSYSTK